MTKLYKRCPQCSRTFAFLCMPCAAMPPVVITDAMVHRALAERVELIQGFTYHTRHCIRDFRTDASGPVIWECMGGDTAKLMLQLNFLKMKARLTSALSSQLSRTGE